MEQERIGGKKDEMLSLCQATSLTQGAALSHQTVHAIFSHTLSDVFHLGRCVRRAFLWAKMHIPGETFRIARDG